VRGRQSGPGSVAAWYACPFDSLRRLIGDAPLNRDDLPIVEYRAPRDLYRVGEHAGFGALAASIPTAGWVAAAAPFASWPREVWLAGRARQLARSGYEDAARSAAAEGAALGGARLAQDIAAAIDAEAHTREVVRLRDAARAAVAGRRWTEARGALERAAELDPEDGQTWVMLADVRLALGDPAAARTAIARAVAAGDSMERSYARMIEGVIEMQAGRPRAAADAFAEAARWQPATEAAWIQCAQALRAAGDTAAAIGTVREGLLRTGGGPMLRRLLAELEPPGSRP
jgi:tetratricopeptide (TPR) repeat protein